MNVQPFSAEAISPQPLHSVVAGRLRDLIVEGDLAPGERLNERLLSERFGISRTPLREAIKMLSSEGLVKLLPNRGAVVTTLTVKDAEDMFQVMSALEGLAGELVCGRVTEKGVAEMRHLHALLREQYEKNDLAEYIRLNQRIHEKIVDLAGNAELKTLHGTLSARVRRARFMANFSRERWAEAMADHDEALKALEARDGPRLAALLKSNLAKKFHSLRERLATE